MRTVIALGGNAIAPEGTATVTDQRERIAATADPLAELSTAGHDLLLTHGNGPQVGQLLRQQEAAEPPARPLDVLVAETQAQIGYLIADQVDAQVPGHVTTVMTRVRVDPDDPDFDDPSKPIGPYYDEGAAAEKPFETGAVTTPEGERAYRRLVPSPRPLAVLEDDEISGLVEQGATVVCGGGGGVPVVADERDTGRWEATTFEGIEAIVDKDYTTQLVASAVDADCLVMATDVEYAYRHFGAADEEPIESADAATMRVALDAGEFAAGSMRPKVEACLAFLAAGGDRAAITTPENVAAAVEGDAGTQIRP